MTPPPTLDATVLFTAHPADAVAFYRACGLELQPEQHDDGPTHWVCELGPVHFALYEATDAPGRRAPGRRQCGASQLGFQVASLDAAYAALVAHGAPILQPPESVPWGRRLLTEDPDGRAVELNERTLSVGPSID